MAARKPNKIELTNVNHPGQVKLVDAGMYEAMRRAFLKILPKTPPGLTEEEIGRRLIGHLPEKLFPGGAKAGWWQKAVQLDLEAKGVVARARVRPLRWHKSMRGGARKKRSDMRYVILCYHSEDVVCAWSKDEDDAVMAKLAVVHDRVATAGQLGPVARLMPTMAATTLRKDHDRSLMLDGPFAETKEQLLGFYVVDCDALEDALAIAQDLGEANPGGAYEVRPIALFLPGVGGA